MHLRRLSIAELASCLATLAIAAPASAGTLDQQQTDASFNAPSGFLLIGNPPGPVNQSGGQVFTPAITGALDQVDLSFNKTGNPPNPVISVEIRSTSAGKPGGNTAVLATAGVPAAAVGATQAFVSVPIAPAVPVTAGTQYAIVAYNAGAVAAHFGWGQSAGDTYPGGNGYVSTDPLPPDVTWNPALGDLAFKTYVAPPPAGNPTSPVNPAGNVRKRKCKKAKKHKKAGAEIAKKKKKKCKKKKKKRR